MTQWTADDPGAGSLDGLELRSRQLAERIEHAASVEVALRQAVSAASAFWAGSGHASWSAAATASAGSWSVLREWGGAERIALRRYAAVVESIATRAEWARSQIESASRELDLLGRVGDLLDPSLVAARVADQNDLLTGARRALDALARERQAADDACIAAIEAAAQEPHGRHTAPARSGADLSSLGDLGLLADLRELDSRALARALASDPALDDRLHAIAPDVVARWWADLDDSSRAMLVMGIPEVVGTLDGVAYRDRDRANHLVLDREYARLSNQPSLSPDDAGRLAALRAVTEALGAGMAARPPRELVSLSLDGNPKAAISVGDLDSAAYVSYLVPGMGTRVAGDLTRYVDAALGMRATETRVVSRRVSVAVVAWLDYDAPGPTDVIGVASDFSADAGGRRLASSLDGLRSARTHSGPPEVTVMGHSYGSNVSAVGLRRSHADHVVLVGSAGITESVPTARDLDVPPGEVFASQAIRDGWAPVGQVISGRQDPTSTAFGARTFSSEEGADEAGRRLKSVTQHGPLASPVEGTYSYFDAQTSAQFGAAMVAVGRGGELEEGLDSVDRDVVLGQRLLREVVERSAR